MEQTLDMMLDQIRGPIKIEGPASLEQWRVLVDRRVELVSGLTENFSLPQFGDMEWVSTVDGIRSVKSICWPNGHAEIPFSTQGVFWRNPQTRVDPLVEYGTYTEFWGMLRRRGPFIKGQLRYDQHPDLSHEHAEPRDIVASLTDLDSLMPEHHHTFWYALGEVVSQWRKNTAGRMRQIDPVADLFDVEGTMVAHAFANAAAKKRGIVV